MVPVLFPTIAISGDNEPWPRRSREIYPMPKAGGKWNTFEITANGRDITVLLNGSKTAELRNGMFDEGPIALQHGSGTIKIRKVEIKPL